MPEFYFTAHDGASPVIAGQRREMDRFTASSKAAAKAERDRAAATHAASHGPSSSRQVTMIGRLMGGEAGGMLRHGSHFSHLTGGFMAAGAAAIAVSMSFKALFAASEHAVEAAKEEAKVRVELKNAMRDSVKAADASAVGAFTQHGDSLKMLASIGGDSMVERGVQLGREHGPDAINAYASLAAKGKEGYIGAVIEASRTGRISMGGAAGIVAQGNVTANGGNQGIAAQILSQESNAPVNAAQVASWQNNLRGSNIGWAAHKREQGMGELAGAGIHRFSSSSDSIMEGIAKQIHAIMEPEKAGRHEVAMKMDDQLAVLRAASQTQGRMVQVLEEIAAIFGGGGSAHQAYEKAIASSRAAQH